MLEVLQFYVSGFWVWAGITWGLVALGAAISQLARSVLWGA
jgi:hypothetical protein